MSNSHDALTNILVRGWMRETGCDQVTAEIRADREIGGMHDAGECPICNKASKPRVDSVDDLTDNELEAAFKAADALSSLTWHCANAGSDEQIVRATREFYAYRCALIKMINARSSRRWDVHSIIPMVIVAGEVQSDEMANDPY